MSAVEGEGQWLFRRALDLELEGIVAKRLGSIYRPGTKSSNVLKIKRKGHVRGWKRTK